MSKIKNSEVLSLDTTKQKEIVKQTKELKKKIKDGTIDIKAIKSQKLTLEQSRGLLFISHLPHGFYEDELKKYFQQFGKVTNVKVCRSSRSGRSKGFGYVEFSHPDVAKIAAETMNNYLMFKKRITAEFVPYEKRPKGLFIGKPTTLERFSSKIRRQKQHQANLKIDESTHIKRTKSRLSRLNRGLERLRKMGIKTTYKPENIAVIKQENKHPSLNEIYQDKNFTDSDKDIQGPVKKSLKSVKSVKSLPEKNPKKIKKITKSKSLTAIKSKNKSESVTEQKIDVSISPVVKKNPKKKSNLTNAGGVIKRNKKPAPLNSETVRKIARELIRKRGDTLLNYPVNLNGKSKKKSPKK